MFKILLILLISVPIQADYKFEGIGGSAGAPPGNDKEIIFNDGGVFGADSAFIFDKVNSRLGVGTSPVSAIHIKAEPPGTVGSEAGGQLIIQSPTDNLNANAVITGYSSNGAGNPVEQLWYFGSSSGSNSNITILNRQNATLSLGTNNLTRMTIASDGNITHTNFTQLGSDAPIIKMKKLTGTTAATEGNNTNIAHGLTLNKIIGFTVLVTASNGNKIPPNLGFTPEFEYEAFLTSTNVIITLDSTNSGNLLSGAITVLITHEE